MRISMRESKIEKELTEWVKLAGGQAYKLVSPGNNGMPDRLGDLPGSRADLRGAESGERRTECDAKTSD